MVKVRVADATQVPEDRLDKMHLVSAYGYCMRVLAFLDAVDSDMRVLEKDAEYLSSAPVPVLTEQTIAKTMAFTVAFGDLLLAVRNEWEARREAVKTVGGMYPGLDVPAYTNAASLETLVHLLHHTCTVFSQQVRIEGGTQHVVDGVTQGKVSILQHVISEISRSAARERTETDGQMMKVLLTKEPEPAPAPLTLLSDDASTLSDE